MLTNATELNSVGGGFGGLGGGLGGFGLFGLLGLKGIGDLDGKGNGNGMVAENAILAAIGNSKDATVAEGRNLANAICESEKTALQQFYAAAIQASNNTQAIKDQATGFYIANDKRFDDLSAAGVAQTAAILAKINQTEIDSLRDRLAERTREVEAKNSEINVTQIVNQQQQQFQAQNNEFGRRFDALYSQVAKSGQDIINVGGLMAGVAQTANPTNVNSK